MKSAIILIKLAHFEPCVCACAHRHTIWMPYVCVYIFICVYISIYMYYTYIYTFISIKCIQIASILFVSRDFMQRVDTLWLQLFPFCKLDKLFTKRDQRALAKPGFTPAKRFWSTDLSEISTKRWLRRIGPKSVITGWRKVAKIDLTHKYCRKFLKWEFEFCAAGAGCAAGCVTRSRPCAGDPPRRAPPQRQHEPERNRNCSERSQWQNKGSENGAAVIFWKVKLCSFVIAGCFSSYERLPAA